MLILAVSTSGYMATAALVRDGACERMLSADTTRRHAQTVLPLLEQVLSEANVTLPEVDLFAVDVGPGSFTGVRIGVSAVNAVAHAQQKQVIGVDALRGVYQAYADTDAAVCVLLCCGNGNGYAARFQHGKVLAQPEAVVIQPYLETLPEGMQLVSDVDTDGEQPLIPTAEQIGQAAFTMLKSAQQSVLPMYLRPSQAERMWKLRQEANRDDA